MMESEKATPFGDISNTHSRKEPLKEAPIKMGPGGDNNENEKENDESNKNKISKALIYPAGNLSSPDQAKKTRGTRGGRKNREKIARVFEKTFPAKEAITPIVPKLDLSTSSAVSTESENWIRYSVEELISFRKSSIAKTEPKFLCECPLTKKKSGLEEVKILPVPFQQDGTIGNIIAKILNRSSIEPIKGDLPHFVRRSSISPLTTPRTENANMEKNKPATCDKFESRESFIREDAARKHKMRPPTAPEYQPYEFAEIQYNPTFNDPNVEYCPMPVYYYVPYYVPAMPLYAEPPPMSNSSSLSSIFSRSESIPEFIPSYARSASAQETLKNEDEPLATPLDSTVEEEEDEDDELEE